MGQRTDLQTELETILGSKNVYFQPPESIKINYPAIVYARSSGDTRFADNQSYTFFQSYDVTAIDRNPDSNLGKDILKHFPMARFDRSYTSGNLNHDIIHLYY